MRVFKPTRKGPRGAQIAYSAWYVEFRDHEGRVRRLRAFSDRQASAELGRALERLAELRAAPLPPDRELARAIEAWPERVRTRCVEIGLLDPERVAAARPLCDLLRRWRDSIEVRERTPEHVERRFRHATRIFAACRFAVLSDVRSATVEATLRALRERDPEAIERYVQALGPGDRTMSRERKRLSAQGLGFKASNHVLAAARQFTRWACEKGFVSEDPLRSVRPLNARTDRRRIRRALPLEEIRRVVQTAHDGPDWRGVPGPTRALLYVLASETGLRYKELRSLRIASFNLSDPSRATVEVPASDTKNREDAWLELRSASAQEFASFFSGRGPLERAFPELPAGVGAAMLAEDLRRAGIPYEDESGRVADFHALRGQAATHALEAGASPKVAQELLRHSSADLTLGLYARVRPGERRAVVENFPDILPAKEATSYRAASVASCVAFPGSSDDPAGASDGQSASPGELQTALRADGVVTPRGFEPLSPG